MTTIRQRLEWMFNPNETLEHRAANAGLWAFLQSLLTRLLRMGRAFLLARLISPENWGLMGIGLLVVEMAHRFSQTGVVPALIQRKGDLTEEDLSSGWTLELLRAVLLAALVILLAPFAATFFNEPQATPLLRIMGLGLLIMGAANTAVVEFDRKLEFQRRFVYRTLPHLVEALASVALALLVPGAWALVIGWLLGKATFTVASYLVHSVRPKLRFVWAEARRLLSFGKWIFIQAIVGYFILHTDQITVGRLAGATSLGLYQMAYTMSQLSATEIGAVTQSVAFPAFASLQDRPEAISRAYLRSVEFLAFFAFPLTAGVWFVGPDFVDSVLGTRWRPVISVLGVLLLWGLMRAMSDISVSLLHGVGQPGVVTRNKSMQLFVLAALVIPLTARWGIAGAAWSTVLAASVGFWLIRSANRQTDTKWSDYCRALLFPAVGTGIMLAVLVGIDSLEVLPRAAWTLLWAPIVGLATYLGCARIARPIFGTRIPGLDRGGA
jgi:O-antigen/teichoic acid export membrane protein